MKTIFKKSAALLVMLATLSASCTAYAKTGAYDGSTPPTTNEELEYFTTTKRNPYTTRYALVNKDNVENGYKGGEGFQCGMSFAICDANEKIMLRGDDTSGVHISTDGGETWHMSKTRIKGVVTGLCFYPGSERVCFAHVTGMPWVAGIYKSIDGGETWNRTQQIYGPDKNMANCKITAGAYNAETGTYALYSMHNGGPGNTNWPAGSDAERGLWKSLDMGETWEQVAFAGYDIYGMYADRESNLVIVCTNDFGVSVSYDGGQSWTEKNNGWEQVGARVITVDPYNKQHWLAVKTNNIDKYQRYMHYDEADRKGRIMNIIYETYDGGENWTHLTTDWGDREVSSSAGCHQLMFSYRKTESGQTIVYAQLEECVYCTRVSYDGGKTFEYPEIDLSNSLEADSTGWYQSPMGFSPNVTQAGVFGCPAFYDEEKGCLVLSNSGISGGLGMNYYWDENGKMRFLTLMDVGIFRVGDYSGENQDYSWYDGNFPIGKICENYAWGSGGRSCDMIAVDPNDKNHCFGIAGAVPYGLNSIIVETWDGFETSYIYTDIYDIMEEERNNGTASRNTRFLKYHPNDPNTVYSSWFVSRNNGKHWQETQYEIRAIGYNDGDVCYSIYDKQLYMSTDGARTWFGTGYYIDFANGIYTDMRDDYVVWIPNRGSSKLYRVDIRNSRMETLGPDNGLMGDEALKYPKDLQIKCPAQDPNNYDHWIVNGVDFYSNMAGYLFETYDNGETWKIIYDLPGAAGVFHPTKPLYYVGDASGTYVYDFSINAKLNKDYFLDIDDSVYKPEIKALAKAGVIKYDIDGNFYPSQKLTRSTLAAIICRAKGEAAQASLLKFDDVDSSDENKAYILYACDKGYMKADGTKFNPEGTVTFGEFAEYIMTILSAEENEAYEYCVKNEIFKADFAKDEEATDEQAAYALFKALGLEYIDEEK